MYFKHFKQRQFKQIENSDNYFMIFNSLHILRVLRDSQQSSIQHHHYICIIWTIIWALSPIHFH